jgi:hypothetical protein
MTLLRVLRNWAVLVIVTVAVGSLNPRAVAANSSCGALGSHCKSGLQCCSGICAVVGHYCCNKRLPNMSCNNSDVCCTGLCIRGHCS